MFELKGLYKRTDTWPANENWPARPLVFMLDPETGVDYRVDATAEVVSYLEEHQQRLTLIAGSCVVASASKTQEPRLRLQSITKKPAAEAAKAAQ